MRWEHPIADRFAGRLHSAGRGDRAGRASRRMGPGEGTDRWRPGRRRSIPTSTLSVNLSSRQLADPELPAVVRRILETSGLPADKLCLELTETALIEDPASAERCLTELRGLGVRIAVDDFGTGYSSLIYVRRFPVQMLKLDRLFVAGLGESAEDETIAGLGDPPRPRARPRGVAEGVETLDQLHALDSLGCDLAQGSTGRSPARPRR